MAHHLFLTPGYLGFRGIEGVTGYWDGVLPLLRERGFICHPVHTDPVAKIARRAERLRDAILAVWEEDSRIGREDVIHLLGHSTGGLDARYLLSPGTSVELPKEVRRRVRTVLSLATPHHGTPIADFYYALRAEDLLGLFAKIGVRWTTEERLNAAGRFFQEHRGTIEKALPHGLAREFYRLVEGVVSAVPEVRVEIQDYLSSLARHRGALKQLRVRQMADFNAIVDDAPDVRYTCYVTGTPPPKDREFPTTLYALSTFISSRWIGMKPPPMPNLGIVPPEKIATLDGKPLPPDAEPIRLTEKLSDGVVPTASQFWGDFRLYVPVDHHSIIGRFHLLPQLRFGEGGLAAFYRRLADDLEQNVEPLGGA